MDFHKVTRQPHLLPPGESAQRGLSIQMDLSVSLHVLAHRGKGVIGLPARIHVKYHTDPGKLISPIVYTFNARLFCTVGTAVKNSVSFDTVSYNAAIAVVARRRQHVNGALKTIKDMAFTTAGNGDRLVILISADFTLLHENLPGGNW